MSAQLVMAGPGQPVVHNSLHDLESFFYVLVGICVLFKGPSTFKTEAELEDCFDKFFNTYEPDVLKTLVIQSDLTWFPLVMKHIHPYFESVIPLLSRLRAEIVLPLAMNEREEFYRKTPCNHATFIKHIITALSELQPKDWAVEEQTSDDWRTRAPSKIKRMWTDSEPEPPTIPSLLVHPPLYRSLTLLVVPLSGATRVYNNLQSEV